MRSDEIRSIIKNGENIRVEFKTSRNNLPSNLFETICAFLNTKGGIVLLGVDDAGNILGIEKKIVNKLKKDIANLSKNPEKLNPTFILSAEEFEIDNKIILAINVPESSQVHKCNNEIYVRNEDGDYKVSHPTEIAKIVNRKEGYHTEQRVIPNISFPDFNNDLIARAKNLIKINSSEHHWAELDNKDFLARAGFYRKNEENKSGYTLASVLFFGTDKLIQSVLPAYKFEALLRKQNVDRYDDRLTVRTNLIDAYDLLMGFIEKHLNDPFYLEGTTRISLRSKIFRELVANIIAHREYLNSAPAFINIFNNKIEFTNPNNPKVFGKIDPDNFTPAAKNPTISKLMLQMGRVEEVGSGMRNVSKYLPHYSPGATFEFVDEDMFITVINLGKVESQKAATGTTVETSGKSSQETTVKTTAETTVKILELIDNNNKITRQALAETLGITIEGVDYNIKKLKKESKLKRIGPDKGGYWKISYESSPETSGKSSRETTVKTTAKTTVKILELIDSNNKITRQALAETLGLTIDGIDYNIKKLKKEDRLKRIGPDKGGYWQIIK